MLPTYLDHGTAGRSRGNAIEMGDIGEMFDWEDETLEDRCLDLQGKVRKRVIHMNQTPEIPNTTDSIAIASCGVRRKKGRADLPFESGAAQI